MVKCPHCKENLAAAVLASLPKVTSVSTEDQEAALLKALREAGPVGLTTPDLRAAGYLQSSARIWGLRQQGAVIDTELYDGIGPDGVWHPRMARYRLVSEPLLPKAKPTRKGRQKAAEATTGGEAMCS